jgi:hypothetical protein
MEHLMDSSLTQIFALDMGMQCLAWTVAAVFQTELFYDLTGSLAFILCNYWSYINSRHTIRQFVQSGMVLIWALRYFQFSLLIL